MNNPLSVFWFRRDLRLEDNHGLIKALESGYPVLPIFIFDKEILAKLENKNDKRVDFIYQALVEIKSRLESMGSTLLVLHETPIVAFKNLIKNYTISAVYTNNDYEPVAIERDRKIEELLIEKKISFQTFKDQVIFEKNEVVKDDGTPYTVFTPYSKRWKVKLNENPVTSFLVEKYANKFFQTTSALMPTLKQIGFEKTEVKFAKPKFEKDKVENYHLTRNLPALDATTHLSVHLRFGTISIRELVNMALHTNEAWLNELIWREFFMQILWHFPQVVSQSFKSKYDRIVWQNDENLFKAWCDGKTGFPIVDAGMRELNATGFMHNRVRMIVASFLVKDLLIDWRWGEAYFAQKLLDYDLSANNGNWQWAAGSGCDSAPYFRIFNPSEQTKKFDPKLEYVKKWVPEFDTLQYPTPIIDHSFARTRCLKVYKAALY